MIAGVTLERDRLRRTTAPHLLCERARSTPDAVAFRSKHFGIFRERSWRAYAMLVAHAARALQNLGVGRGERVAIMGDVCEEWMICDLAAQSLGAVTYGIYPTASPAEVEYQMRDGGARLFIAEDQEYVDKILPIANRLPDLQAIVVLDDSAMFAYAHDRLHRFSQLLAAVERPDLAWLEAQLARLSPEDPAFIVYTSGTTGQPKGALVNHGKHLAAADTVVTQYVTLREKLHRTVVYLPLCHVLGRDVAITLPLISRLVPHFGEDPEDFASTLFEVAPTVLFTVPRYLQKFASHVLVGMLNSSRLKRAAYDLAMRFARRHAVRRWDGDHPVAQEGFYRCLRAIVFKPILNKLGFDRLELVVSGGAALPAETAALWQIYGINVVEMYGQTEEAGGIIAGQRGPFPRPGNVGTPAEGIEVKLGEGGEVLVRSPDLFEGYWGNKEATSDVCAQSSCSTTPRCSVIAIPNCVASAICWPPLRKPILPGSKRRLPRFHPTTPPSSSIPPALPVIRKVRWSLTGSISPRPIRSSGNTRPCVRSSTAPSSICRCVTCSGATSLLHCR